DGGGVDLAVELFLGVGEHAKPSGGHADFLLRDSWSARTGLAAGLRARLGLGGGRGVAGLGPPAVRQNKESVKTVRSISLIAGKWADGRAPGRRDRAGRHDRPSFRAAPGGNGARRLASSPPPRHTGWS